ncbi:MAG: type II toxin-antitoxin system Phd/YefM family antitoxin [Terracidiphilus sp.]
MGKTQTKIPVSISAAQARSNLGQIIRRASGKNPERFVIGLRGEPKVIVMGLEDYLDTIAPEHPVMAEIRAISKANGTDKLTMDDIDAEIAAYRAEQRALDADSVRIA